MHPHDIFAREVAGNIESLGRDEDLHALSRIWIREISHHKWAYNFAWLGRPAIQFPTDAWAMQEIIWKFQPDLIIETGIAHGGSLIFYASMLSLLDLSDAITSGQAIDPRESNRKVIGIDIDIRQHNREAIESHPLSSRITMIQGSSISPEIITRVNELAVGYKRVLVCLDSMHTHDHVLAELEAYAPLVNIGGYCVVFDTIIEDMPQGSFPGRPWDKGNNPKTAVWKYLETHSEFMIDKDIQNKLLITVAPDGFLKRLY